MDNKDDENRTNNKNNTSESSNKNPATGNYREDDVEEVEKSDN